MTYLHIDLCCGLGGWQQPFRESPDWRSIGIDVRTEVSPDVVGDVRQLPIRPDVTPTLVTASPPCQPYSAAWNAVKPPAVRYPDFTLWNACVAAIATLAPEWCVLENVAQAQYWHGPSDKCVGAYHLWGRFPPFDVEDPPKKGTGKAVTNRADITDTDAAATIPYALADALRKAVETWSTA